MMPPSPLLPYYFFPTSAYVSTLAKFTYLTSEDKISSMKAKNISAIRVIVEVALNDGNYLRSSWPQVLQCVTQLARLQALPDREYGSILKFPACTKFLIPFFFSLSPPRNDKMKRKTSVEETGAQTMVVAVDRIFASSPKLSGVCSRSTFPESHSLTCFLSFFLLFTERHC